MTKDPSPRSDAQTQTSVSRARPVDNFIAGGCASIVSKLVLQPFDTAKTLVQAARQARPLGIPSHTQGEQYTNFADAIFKVARRKGLGGVYRGISGSIATSAPSSAVFFTMYETAKRALREVVHGPAAGWAVPVLAAAMANVAASSIRVPPEVVKQRMQTGMYSSGLLRAARTLVAAEGVRGLYTGYTIQLLRDIPYSALQFATYETLSARALQGNANCTKTPTQAMLIGAASGAVACLSTMPLDVIKTRIMTEDVAGRSAGVVPRGGTKTRKYVGVAQSARRIWVEEGPRVFMRGAVPRLLYKIPSSAVFLVAYEVVSAFLAQMRNKRKEMQHKETTHVL